MDKQLHVPPGHFYSPLVDVEDLRARVAELWPPQPVVVPGVDFDDARHLEFLNGPFAALVGEYDYPDANPNPGNPDSDAFFTFNSQFEWFDSRALYVMLRTLAPKRLVEVGSGFTTLLMADVNRRYLGGGTEITCIEPFPRPFLSRAQDRLGSLIQCKVQDASLETFDALEAGDVLFVDSSHVSKTGSDVNYLVFEVLPRLRPGVIVHFHDIFLPAEYPREWVLGEQRSWNEQYVIRALLMYSNVFRVRFGCAYAFFAHRELIGKVTGVPSHLVWGGASLWIEKLATQETPPGGG
jgi:predicted O-methyltransferase YrrM